MSVEYTRPEGPTTLENRSVQAPNPAPTSATVIPGFSSNSFTSSGTSSSAVLICPSVKPGLLRRTRRGQQKNETDCHARRVA